MIPPYVQQVIGVLVRAAIVWFAGYLAAHGGPTFTDDQVTKAVTEIATLLAVLGWSIYTKYQSRVKYHTALASTVPMSDAQAEWKVKANPAAAPSVLTAKDEIPR